MDEPRCTITDHPHLGRVCRCGEVVQAGGECLFGKDAGNIHDADMGDE